MVICKKQVMISAGITVSCFHSDWELSAEIACKSDYFSVENGDSWGSRQTLNALRALLLIKNDFESSPLFPSSFNLESANNIVCQWNAHHALVISIVCSASSCLPEDKAMAFNHITDATDSVLASPGEVTHKKMVKLFWAISLLPSTFFLQGM